MGKRTGPWLLVLWIAAWIGAAVVAIFIGARSAPTDAPSFIEEGRRHLLSVLVLPIAFLAILLAALFGLWSRESRRPAFDLDRLLQWIRGRRQRASRTPPAAGGTAAATLQLPERRAPAAPAGAADPALERLVRWKRRKPTG